ncbi:MAG TPA: hypothetical protein VIU38_05700 [Anaerolineales bacterium]
MRRPLVVWLAALILGLALGLTYAWVIAPGNSGGTAPSSLRPDFRDDYRSAIAAAYAATGDLQRAKARLELLGDADPVSALGAQAQRALAAGQSFEHAQELARLASDLQAGRPSIFASTVTAAIPPSPTLTATLEPAFDLTSTVAVMTASPQAVFTLPPAATGTRVVSPTRTVMPSPAAQFQLTSRDEVCDPALPAGLLQITVFDKDNHPLPGVDITITWDQGEERFFTGYQPEISDGYADYVMQPGTAYSVKVTRLGVPVSALSAPTCPGTGGQSFTGGLKLSFKEP